MKNKTNWYNPNDWTIRENKARRTGKSDKGKHPSIAVGENESFYANLGLTHNAKRGHHKNIELEKNPNPYDKSKSYIRDDLQYHRKDLMKNVLFYYDKLSDKDKQKIIQIINKKK